VIYSSLTIYSKLVATPDAVYVVGVSKSFASFTLHATSLHPATGAVLSTKAIPSSITEPLSELLVISLSTPKNPDARPHHQAPHIVWLEQNALKSVLLTSTLDGKARILKGARFGRIVDTGLCEHGHFVATTADGTSKVVKIGGDTVKDVFEFVSLCFILQF
jgi:ER membrane protein complex subunit 1